MNSIHDVREHFSLDKFLNARELTKKVVHQVQKRCFVGMSEKDGHEIIDDILNEYQCDKKWHPNKFRIGINTTKTFRAPSEEGIKLKENDLYFVDIGPVFDGHEGDYGETFVVGEDDSYLAISEASKKVFQSTRKVWLEESLTGEALYNFAKVEAQTLGYELNDRMKGHRVGDFPHHLFYKGGMIETQETPADNLWVLEIHLISKCGTYGAFYEDILSKKFD